MNLDLVSYNILIDGQIPDAIQHEKQNHVTFHGQIPDVI